MTHPPAGVTRCPGRSATPENVLLACESCHEEIDDQLVTGILDVARLTAIKAAHEQRIRHVTTLPDDQRSLVLRVVGKLRGEPVEVTPSTAAKTVIDSGRFPWFDLDRDRLGAEVDLRSLPGERTADEDYYRMACRAIDEVVETRLHDAIRSGDVRHVSVFAFARLPLLVYLGAKLEDNCTIEVYQRHRNTQQWAWNDEAEDHHFAVTADGALDVATEAVLILNVSGRIDPRQIPQQLAGLPLLVIAPDATPGADVLASRGSLNAFCTAVRDLNATLDAVKNVRRLHVIGALPPAAAVELGRLHDQHIHPALVVYSRTNDDTYLPALEIP